jgi:hypothetical protein
MLSAFMLMLAPTVAANGPPARPIQEFRQGPMPAENIWLRPAHPQGFDDGRMFPDIAIGEFRIDGDTLYVRVLNKGHSPTPGGVLVAARAAENGSKTELVEQRTAKLLPGEARWVTLRGFAVKTAAAAPAVFALESASAVSAVARMMPSSAPALDRSGETREVGTEEGDEANNVLTLAAEAIKHGKPQ